MSPVAVPGVQMYSTASYSDHFSHFLGRPQSPSTPLMLVRDMVLNSLHPPSASNPEHGLILHCLLWICAARSSSIFLSSLLLWQPPTAGVPPVCLFRTHQLICQPWPQAAKAFSCPSESTVQRTVIRMNFTARQERAPLNFPNTGYP